MRIIDLIMRFETHSRNAQSGAEKDISDYYVYSTVAMECFQSVNALIEIGEWTVTERRLGFPSTYRDIFELLHNHGMIDQETFEAIKRLIFLRNVISHEYYKIGQDELVEMVDLLRKVEKLIQLVKQIEK